MSLLVTPLSICTGVTNASWGPAPARRCSLVKVAHSKEIPTEQYSAQYFSGNPLLRSLHASLPESCVFFLLSPWFQLLVSQWPMSCTWMITIGLHNILATDPPHTHTKPVKAYHMPPHWTCPTRLCALGLGFVGVACVGLVARMFCRASNASMPISGVPQLWRARRNLAIV